MKGICRSSGTNLINAWSGSTDTSAFNAQTISLSKNLQKYKYTIIRFVNTVVMDGVLKTNYTLNAVIPLSKLQQTGSITLSFYGTNSNYLAKRDITFSTPPTDTLTFSSMTDWGGFNPQYMMKPCAVFVTNSDLIGGGGYKLNSLFTLIKHLFKKEVR